jgi:sulfate adenylyltransferase subunit 2
MKTEALKQAFEKHGFDTALGGARRDEEKSRVKERIFSNWSGLNIWQYTAPSGSPSCRVFRAREAGRAPRWNLDLGR